MASMNIFQDFKGRRVRLTAERWKHILEHPEMMGQEGKIGETLRSPDFATESEHDPDEVLYHKLFTSTPVTRKTMLVAVKYLKSDAFVVTAFFVSKPRKGRIVWLRR